MKSILLISALLLCFGCVASPRTGPLLANVTKIPDDCGSSTEGVVLNAICAGRDLAAMTISKPEPRKMFEYSETDEFDLQLSASMGKNLGKIIVNVEGDGMKLDEIANQTVAAADSERVVFWLARIRDTGGTSIQCQVDVADRDLDIAGYAIKLGAAYLQDWMIYKPADDYNARVFFDPSDETKPIRRFEFVTRGANKFDCEL